MESIQRDEFLRQIKPYVRDLVTDILVESFKKGEMKEIFEDLLLAKSMAETEKEDNLSKNEALKLIEWK